jgi:steroid delta-isomerase-like uncharacterized protein
MAADDNKALYRRFLDALNGGDLAAAAALMAPDFVNHTPLPGEPPGVAGLRFRMGMLRTGFPDLRFAMEAMIAEDDTVATRGTLSGTHAGPLAGMPPTGKQVRVGYIDMVRFANGTLVEHWVQTDQMGMMQQLGMAPMPG